MKAPIFLLAPLVLAGCVVSADPGQVDGDAEDSGLDTAIADSTSDSRMPDTTVVDTGRPPVDSGTSVPDTGLVESGTPDTGTTDTGCAKPDTSVCDYTTNCGCAAGQKCDFISGTGLACVAAGATATGSLCFGTGSCASSLTCRGYYCQVKCSSGADCLSGQCGNTFDALGFESTLGTICSQNCNLVYNFGCTGSSRCTYDETSKIRFCADASGSVAYGDVCKTSRDCKDPSRFCSVDGSGTGTKRCYQWCLVSETNPCGTTGSWTCVPYGPPGYGFCRAA